MSERLTDEERDFLLYAELPENIQVVEAPSEDSLPPSPHDPEFENVLKTYQEDFALRVATELTKWVNSDVDVAIHRISRPTYGEFVFGLDHPTCFEIIDSEPLNSPIVMELHPEFIYPLLDRLMGGGSLPTPTTHRTMTDFEKRIVATVTTKFLDCLSDAWPIDFDAKLTQIESNPKLARCAHPLETVIATEFRVAVGNTRGTIRIAISESSLLPHKPLLLDPPIPEIPEPQLVDFAVCMAHTTLNRDELMDLRVGDILMADTSADEGAIVYVDDQPVFRGQAVSQNGQKAVLIRDHIVGNHSDH
jgi:flagellar motor switch protein FliM